MSKSISSTIFGESWLSEPQKEKAVAAFELLERIMQPGKGEKFACVGVASEEPKPERLYFVTPKFLYECESWLQDSLQWDRMPLKSSVRYVSVRRGKASIKGQSPIDEMFVHLSFVGGAFGHLSALGVDCEQLQQTAQKYLLSEEATYFGG